jgi:hypothetical protein
MKGMLPERADKIDNNLKLTDSAHDRGEVPAGTRRGLGQLGMA